MASNTPSRMFAENNQFRFMCPIFGAEVALKQCFQLRDVWAKGKKLEVRRGCQACMSSSKCPIIPMIQDAIYKSDADDYFTTEPTVGKLKPRLLERIAKIIVGDRWINHYAVPSNEATRILACNPSALEAQMEVGRKVSKKRVAALKQLAETPKADAIVAAAESGDMSAAINQAMESTSATS